ncbi:MAG: peptide chain release factor 2 [Erysipelotrichia bacterium]|nr:peptide chain release factor 2 [Erysipelotrichia bacterium]NCC54389.1 peptide chain release factor 2 [Erysipelotrichia bacterium]
MELYEIKANIDRHQAKLKELGDSLDLAGKNKRIKALEAMQLEDDFWQDQNKAQIYIRECNGLKHSIVSYEQLKDEITLLLEMCDVLKSELDEEMLAMLNEEYVHFEQAFTAFEVDTLLSHEYDRFNAVLELHPGAGGTESCDWAEMLYRMYSRYASKKGFKVSVLDYLAGDEAGIKSITFLVEGESAYGYLKAEKGVHRLVRISPFDASGRRHTSFASLDVMPQFNDSITIDIDEKELEVETMRSSGAGGQHVNKTDSAVRVTHIPTGISVKCQNGRSQHDNKEQAMLLLKSKLYQREIEEQMKKVAAIKGEQKLIEWGSQIRSYVFHPYTMVKDHRTNYETTNIQQVMDGDLDAFIFAFLKVQVK